MRIKEFLVKSGGVISSIALLGSMLTMAGAAGDVGGNCAICNNTLISTSVSAGEKYYTYQEVYNIGNIPGLTCNTERAYAGNESTINLKWYICEYNGEEICIDCLKKMVAEYKAANANNLSAPGVGNTPITVTAAASTFNVTVPTSIPLVVNADGTVTAPTDIKLVNGSASSIQVSSIAMNNGDWTLTDYNSGNRSKLAEAKVDSKELGLSLAVTGNAAVTSKDGNQTPEIDTSKWSMSGGSELPITVGAIATASSAKSVSEVTAANVVFTLAWKQPVLITFAIDGKTYQAEEGMTWGDWVKSAYFPEISVFSCHSCGAKSTHYLFIEQSITTNPSPLTFYTESDCHLYLNSEGSDPYKTSKILNGSNWTVSSVCGID